MTQENNSRLIARVRKMLALANDEGASQGERDNALRMAHAVLAKHNLELSEVEGSGDTDRADLKVETRSRPWIRHIAHGIAEMLFCHHFYGKTRSNYENQFFVGRPDNTATAKHMLDYLIASAHKESAARFPGDATARSSFHKGVAAAVVKRCHEIKAEALRAEQQQAAAGTGTSLVLAGYYQQEAERNAKYIAEQMKLRLAQSRNRERNTGDVSAYHSGKEFGSRVSLNRQVPGAGSAAARLK
jgi:hypothetical protein